MEFAQVLHMRRSVRGFTPKQVTAQELAKILRAAQTAPLAMGDDKNHAPNSCSASGHSG